MVMNLCHLPKESSRYQMDLAFPAAFTASAIHLSTFDPESSALIVVDMINGFAIEGALSSPNTHSIISPIAQLMSRCQKHGIATLLFADTHSQESPEFQSYPVHCLQGSVESEPVQELYRIGGYDLIAKNSTNGFLEPEFQQWLATHPQITSFIVTGCCTDICVQQFSLALKTEFNRRNLPSRVVVPMELTATYDAPGHPAWITELASYQNMQTSGVEIVTQITD